MNAPDPWSTFDPPVWWNPPLTAEELAAWEAEEEAEQYAREQVATAQSEAAFAANQQEYAKK